jgi:AraC-like DNA-binding protein
MSQSDIFRIKSITQLHELLGEPKPNHPLVSVIDVSKIKITPDMIGKRMSSDFYMISLKDHDCGMLYGRKHYDFEEGVLIFYEPGQVLMVTQDIEEGNEPTGWILYFHPDLIRRSPLADKIQDYSFFSYEVNEALHVSDQERAMLYDCVEKIKYEYNQNIDALTQDLIVNNIELMLNYSNRFYQRQFHTRSNSHKDVVVQFKRVLRNYINSEELGKNGMPSVRYFADQVHLSANYLSDLLKRETGKNAKDHLNEQLVDKAKRLLLQNDNTVGEIAYQLGFNYPHYFTRMFKLHTGKTPNEYRMIG